jgi:hypothetical protein
MSEPSTEERLRHALVAELDAVPVRPVSEEEVLARARRQTRIRQRRAGALVTVLVLAGGAGLALAVHRDGGDEVVVDPAAEPSAVVTTAPVPSAAVPTEPAPTLAPTVTTGTAPAAATVTTTPAAPPETTVPDAPGSTAVAPGPTGPPPHPEVDEGAGVVRIVDERGVLAVVALPDPHPYDPTGSIQPGDVTGDGRVDFIVPFMAAQPVGAVLSDHGGGWRFVPVGMPDHPYTGILPRVGADGRLEILYRECVPSCAAGLTEWRPWVYDGEVFRPAS